MYRMKTRTWVTLCTALVLLGLMVVGSSEAAQLSQFDVLANPAQTDSSPVDIRLVGRFGKTSTPADRIRPAGIATYAGRLIVADETNQRLKVFDVDDPSQIELVAEVDAGCYTCSEVRDPITLQGQHAYIAADPVSIVDLIDPATPQVLGTIDWEIRPVADVAVEANRIYLAWEVMLSIFDVSEPSDPVFVAEDESFFSSWDQAADIEVYQGSAYLFDSDGYVVALDTLGPSGPTPTGRTWVESESDWIDYPSMALAGRRAYVTNGTGLTVLDLGNPTAIDEDGLEVFATLGRFDTGAPLTTMHVMTQGAFVFLTDAQYFRILDARDPEAIVELAAFQHSRVDVAYAMAAAEGERIYVATQRLTDEGIKIGEVYILEVDLPDLLSAMKLYLPALLRSWSTTGAGQSGS